MHIFLLIAWMLIFTDIMVAGGAAPGTQAAAPEQSAEKQEDDQEYYKSDAFRLKVAILAAEGSEDPNTLLEDPEKKSPEIAKIVNALRLELKTSKFFEDMAKKTDDQEQKEMLMQKAESLKETPEKKSLCGWNIAKTPLYLGLLGPTLTLGFKGAISLPPGRFKQVAFGGLAKTAIYANDWAWKTGAASLGYGILSAGYNAARGMVASQDQKKKYQENRAKAMEFVKYGFSGVVLGFASQFFLALVASNYVKGLLIKEMLSSKE